MEQILEAIKKAFSFIKELFIKVINGILNFFDNVVNWFKNLELNQARHVPFVANAQNKQFQEMLQKAPVKTVGIFQGVYDTETETIIHHQYVEADELDDTTINVLGTESLVVLQ